MIRRWRRAPCAGPYLPVIPRHDVVEGRLVLNGGREVRPTSSKHGRYMTTFRKALREPVMAADGTCLNMHEVEAARERWRRKGRS